MDRTSKSIKEMTAFVVADILEDLPAINRILMAVYYLDRYNIEQVACFLEMTILEIEQELGKTRRYLWSKCLEDEMIYRKEFTVIEDDILRRAFIILLQRKGYSMDEIFPNGCIDATL